MQNNMGGIERDNESMADRIREKEKPSVEIMENIVIQEPEMSNFWSQNIA